MATENKKATKADERAFREMRERQLKDEENREEIMRKEWLDRLQRKYESELVNLAGRAKKAQKKLNQLIQLKADESKK
jgi:hypothetical protein